MFSQAEVGFEIAFDARPVGSTPNAKLLRYGPQSSIPSIREYPFRGSLSISRFRRIGELSLAFIICQFVDLFPTAAVLEVTSSLACYVQAAPNIIDSLAGERNLGLAT